MSNVVTRRAVLCGAAGIAAGSVVTSVAVAQAKPVPAAPAALPRLAETDAMAKTFAYYHDAKKVDAKKYPNYKPGQLCSNCLQIRGKDGEVWRPCAIFPKNVVNADGWCKVYVAMKPKQ